MLSCVTWSCPLKYLNQLQLHSIELLLKNILIVLHSKQFEKTYFSHFEIKVQNKDASDYFLRFVAQLFEWNEIFIDSLDVWWVSYVAILISTKCQKTKMACVIVQGALWIDWIILSAIVKKKNTFKLNSNIKAKLPRSLLLLFPV